MEVAERTIVLATPLVAPRRECDRHYHGAGRYTCWHVETPEQQYEVQVVRAGDRLWARCGCKHGQYHEPASCDHAVYCLAGYIEKYLTLKGLVADSLG
jgi:hypothetical protein